MKLLTVVGYGRKLEARATKILQTCRCKERRGGKERRRFPWMDVTQLMDAI